MSHDALLTVLGRAAFDSSFLTLLKENPEAAVRSAGVSLTRDQASQLNTISFDGLLEFGQQVEARRRAAIVGKKDA